MRHPSLGHFNRFFPVVKCWSECRICVVPRYYYPFLKDHYIEDTTTELAWVNYFFVWDAIVFVDLHKFGMRNAASSIPISTMVHCGEIVMTFQTPTTATYHSNKCSIQVVEQSTWTWNCCTTFPGKTHKPTPLFVTVVEVSVDYRSTHGPTVDDIRTT